MERPLVAEPRREKPLSVGVLGQIWTLAETALREADEVVVIGYSLPPADGAAERLIASALSANSAQITVLDPMPRSQHRITELFDHRVRYIGATLEDFLNTLRRG